MNCVNCGANLHGFNITYPLWDGTEERFCTRCLEKFNKIKGKLIATDNREEFLTKNEGVLKTSGLQESGIRYITDYVTLSAKRKEETEKEKAETARVEAEAAAAKEKAFELGKANWNKNAAVFMATTGFNFEGYHIVEYLGIKSGEVVLGTGFLSEFSAGIGDLFGTTSERMADKFTMAKEAAMKRLKENCIAVNANAVIGVDLDISVMASNMIMACANGTAVRIEKIQDS